MRACDLRWVVVCAWAGLAGCGDAAPSGTEAPQEPGPLLLRAGSHSFDFVDTRGNASRPIPVRYHLPSDYRATTPIVVVMHGSSRDAFRYFNDWEAEAVARGFLLLVPEFSDRWYPGSLWYNLGNVFEEEAPVGLRPAERWTFSAIEHLVDTVRLATGGEQAGFRLYGHSAGSQFAHRLIWTRPAAPVERAVLANAGWYTMPDDTVRWPYGLEGTPFASGLGGGLGWEVTVLLGDRDIDPNSSSLRRTPEALAQGAHRFERGHRFFHRARERAVLLGTEFRWQLDTVRGAGHSNAAMVAQAADILMR